MNRHNNAKNNTEKTALGKVGILAQQAYRALFCDQGSRNRLYLDTALAARHEGASSAGCLVFDAGLVRQENPLLTRVESDHVVGVVVSRLAAVFDDLAHYEGDKYVAILPVCNGDLRSMAGLGQYAAAHALVHTGTHSVQPRVGVGYAHMIPGQLLADLVERADLNLKCLSNAVRNAESMPEVSAEVQYVS